jgi:CRP-like cAMP-binding protein
MVNFNKQRQPVGNFILDSLPTSEYKSIEPYLQPTILEKNEVLVKIRQPIERVYFPTTALVSWTNSTAEGETVEVGATGFEGMVGTPLVLDRDTAPWEVDVMISGQAYQLNTKDFIEILDRSPVLEEICRSFTYLKLSQLSQSALCSRFHTVEQRLCRWLLAASDRVKTNELSLTRDNLATMIGSRRPAVSIITGTLQSAGLIRTRRGKVTIIDREAMEKASCECYHIVKQEFDRYLLR